MKPLIVIVSNRGPYSFKKNADGTFRIVRGRGRLVTTLSALAQQHDVLWVAAAMKKDDRIPWPGPDAWRVLPGQVRDAILNSLLRSDRISRIRSIA